MPVTSSWTTTAEVAQRLRRQWDKGQLLARLGTGVPWEPAVITLRGPGPRDLADRLNEVQAWITALEAGSRRGAAYRIEYSSVGGRAFGLNRLPRRACVDNYDQLWTLLGTQAAVGAFCSLLATTTVEAPRAVPWLVQHPLQAVALLEVWPRLLAAAAWLVRQAGEGVYLRQVDVPGVDTKLIEENRRVLGQLVALLLDTGPADPSQPLGNLELRYGFLRKPEYVRLRALGPARLPGGLSELGARVEELSALELPERQVFIVENEVTYLAFPAVENSLVLFGQGYDLTRLSRLAWLHAKRVLYWGDLDTHGFAMLSRLRGALPNVRSLLMDRETLLAHELQWGTEASPINAPLPGLAREEAEVYRGLVENTFGPNVRLEQERINFSWLTRQLESFRPGASRCGAAGPPPACR